MGPVITSELSVKTLALLVAACTTSLAEAKPTDCQAATDELDKFLTTMDHEGNLLNLDHVSPPMRKDLKVRGGELAQGPVIEVRTDGIFFQGDMLTPAALEPKLIEQQKKIQHDIDAGYVPKHLKVDPHYIIVVADAKASWGAVTSALEVAAKTQFDHVTFVFRRPSATPPPPRTHIDDEIEKLLAASETNQATAIANYISPKVAQCPPLIAVFGEVGTNEIEDKAAYLLAHTAPAIAKCNCALDPAEARSIMWQTAGNPKPIMLLRVELDRKAHKLSAPKAKTWGEASARLTAGMKTVWLTAS